MAGMENCGRRRYVGPNFKIESDKVKDELSIDIKVKCSLCKRMFEKKPFERNAFSWVMQHTETPSYEIPSWICPDCKKQLNLFMTKVLMDKKHWKVIEEDEWNEW